MTKQDEVFEYLVSNNFIDDEKAREARKFMSLGKTLDSIVGEKNLLDYEEYIKIKARIYNLQYRNLNNQKISEAVLSTVPIEFSENLQLVCFEKKGRRIEIGMVDPDNFKAVEAINFLAKQDGLTVTYYLISDASFKSALKQFKTLSKEVSSALKRKEEEEAEDLLKKKEDQEEEDLNETMKSAPVAKIASVILRHAVDGRASDIHIEPMQKSGRVRYRIDGVLQTSLVLPRSVHEAVVARIKVIANLKLDERRLPQDGRIRLSIGGKEIDFRVSVLPLLDSEKVVMRILDNSKGAPSLEELGFMGPALEIILKNIQKTEGMFLVTGPTGSGKSTTLFSVINKVNREGVNISTLEDPVEYFMDGVNQSQIRPEIGFTFATGLRSLLRQDPNVIMVGEIRDNETAELAIHASLTGHFVLSTLHTNDAIGAIPRFLDMGAENFLLGSTINSVIAQRLARKICSNCKKEEKLPEEVVSNIKKEIDDMPDGLINEYIPNFDRDKITFYKGSGCSHCGNTGYIGRVAIAEVIDFTGPIKDIIMDGKRQLKIEDVLANQKYTTIKQDGLIKILLGLTTIEEVMRVMFN